MQKKDKSSSNVKPPKEVCMKCESHGFCLAEDGKEEYKCWKVYWLPKHEGMK